LIVLAITGSIIFSLIVWPGYLIKEDPILEENDILNYTISGEKGNESIGGYSEYHISDYSDSGISYFEEISHTGGEMPELYVQCHWGSLDGSPILSEDELIKYTWIDNERIVTPIGEKAVKTLIRQIGLSVVILNIGLHTSLVYRTVVSNPDYHYTILLNSTNSDRVRGADDRYWEHELDSGLRANDEPTGMGNGQGGGMMIWGMLQVEEGDFLRYEIVGMNGTVYVFSISDLNNMELSGDFTFEHDLSIINSSGSVNAIVEPGNYWFTFYQDGTEEYLSSEHGWFYLYFQ
jgi:hypothetical protein